MRLTTTLVLAGAFTATAQADVIISNFSAPVGTGTIFGANATTQYKAFGFTMGADDYTLENVVLSMDATTAMPMPQVAIWSDNGGTPGASLFVLDPPTMPLAGPADYEFPAGAQFTLTAGTSYWIHVVSVPVNGDDFFWDGTNPATLPSGAGATAIGYEFNGSSSSFFNRLEVNGNTGDVGTNYCQANTNSTGGVGQLDGLGSSFVANNDVTLVASNLPPSSFGFFITSQSQGFVPNPNGSAGNLCLGGAIGRYVGPGQIQQADAAGTFSLMLDLTMTPTPTGLVAVVSGDTWNFQGWHRDTSPAGPTSNFTNGLEVDFQ